MGLKDYQQCMVVDWLIKDKSLPVQLETLPTFREKSGLAMSSRNMRLDNEQLVLASSIYECLVDMKERLAPGSLISLKNSGVAFLSSKGFEVDYVEIADAETLEIENEWNGRKPLVFLIAAFLGNVRLIDNLVMNRGSEGT
jgi:pantoate--beta-alanine ligase